MLEGDKMTNSDSVIREFLKEYLLEKSLNTLQDYVIRIKKFLKYVNKDINKITSMDINLWIDHGGNYPTNQDVHAVKIFLEFCIRKGFLRSSCNKAKIF